MGRTINHQSDTIRMMEKCLNYSDNILDYNKIWDKDGSDYMSNYNKYKIWRLLRFGIHNWFKLV